MIQIRKWGMSRSAFGHATILCVWGLTATSVWSWMTTYACTGSVVRKSPDVAYWPSESALARSSERSTLLLFLHPRCPCSAASVQEVQRIITQSGLPSSLQPKIILVASVPTHPTADWFESRTMTLAKSLPNAEVVWDFSGIECQRFEASLSGTARLYRSDGQLLFGGGITVARGHAGASAGGDALLSSLLDQSTCSSPSTPVFGCPLCIETNVLDECTKNQSSRANFCDEDTTR